jgi:outer membrane protein
MPHLYHNTCCNSVVTDGILVRVNDNVTMRAAICAALVLGIPRLGVAQAAPPSPITLNAAVEIAVRDHPAIREVSANARAAADGVAVARTAYLPRLDMLWQANRATRNNVFGLLLPQSVVPAISGPVLGTSTLDSVWSSAGGLLLSWEAIDFGRRGARVDLARAEAGLADAERQVTELEIAGAAADAFLVVAAAEATVTATRANVQRLETFATTVGALVDNQLRAGAERSRAQAELASARTRVIEAERNAALARLALAEVLGSPGASIAIDPRAVLQLPPPPAVAPFDPAAHPRAVAADAQVATARVRDRVLDRSYAPRIDLQTALSGRDVSRAVDGRPAGSAFELDVPNWAIGVSVTFPSLDIFRIQAERRVEAGRLQAATARYDGTLQALQAQDARARAVISAAFAVAANTPQQLEAARDTDTQARARYDAGLTSVLEVAEAQRLLTEAESENAVASVAVWRALLAEAVLRGDLKSFLDRTGAGQAPSVP